MQKVLLLSLLIINLISQTDINKILKNKECEIINKNYYKSCYSYKYKIPLVVWYELDINLIHHKNIKKRFRFYDEKEIPKQYRAYDKDYVRSGYDRGHLATDSAFDYSKESLYSTYSLVNVVPQPPNLNRRLWLSIEKYSKKMVKKYKKLEIINVVYTNNKSNFIGKGILVPTNFMKILSSKKYNYQECFYVSNNPTKNRTKNIFDYKVDCDNAVLY